MDLDVLQRIGNLQAARWCKTAIVSFESIGMRIKVRSCIRCASNIQLVYDMPLPSRCTALRWQQLIVCARYVHVVQ